MNELTEKLLAQAVRGDPQFRLIECGAGVDGVRAMLASEVAEYTSLIIKECVQLALKEKDRYLSLYSYDELRGQGYLECATSMDNYQILVKQHFGVE
jgi:hypothetical protein